MGSPADSLFSKFKSVRSWSGGSDPKKAAPPPFLSLDYLPSSGRLSSPGQNSFLAHFLCPKPQNTMRAVRADWPDFRAEKRPKRPNLSDQTGDTLTHLKALILIHNTSKKKWCLPPAWTSQPACQRDRPPFRREKLFF